VIVNLRAQKLRVVLRKLDQDRRSISEYADPGLRLRKHFISERWNEPIPDQSTVDRAMQDWGNPGLMFSQNLAFWNAICWVIDVRPSVVVVQLPDRVLRGPRSVFLKVVGIAPLGTILMGKEADRGAKF